MALFILKPIFWNTSKYKHPAGVHAAKDSYPGKYGYGHEEWNNSPKLRVKENGQIFQVFHAELKQNSLIDSNNGQIFIFMTVAHDSIFQLVGIAGNAVFLGGDQHQNERKRIARKLDLNSLHDDAWRQPLVQKRFKNDHIAFTKHWNDGCNWLPNWICPEELYWWLDEPITLIPEKLTGKKYLPMMFSAYQSIELPMAEIIMSMVPDNQRGDKWKKLVGAMNIAPYYSVDSDEINKGKGLITTRMTMAEARVGQGRFRDNLLQKWQHSCAVTGLENDQILRASHIKPWAASKNLQKERIDPDNGLLLSANIDSLFDAGLITFNDNGDMTLSKRLSNKDIQMLGLPKSLRVKPDKKQQYYLDYHRKNVFKNEI
jgi:hypothetical protein